MKDKAKSFQYYRGISAGFAHPYAKERGIQRVRLFSKQLRKNSFSTKISKRGEALLFCRELKRDEVPLT